MKKCSDKKEIKKSPESAMATFFPMEDCTIEFAIRCIWIIKKNQSKIQLIANNYNPFILIYNDFKMLIHFEKWCKKTTEYQRIIEEISLNNF